VVNRTSTFAFFLGDHHFGVVTAYVPGPAASGYDFTSALPVQIVRTVGPLLSPLEGPVPPTNTGDQGVEPPPRPAAGR
jgi:hypothetical protein